MVVALLALVLAAISLWSVSVGAVRDVRREESRDLSRLCPAWVPLAGRDDALYRCGAEPGPDGTWCPAHAKPRQRAAEHTHPGARHVEATWTWADARRKMRWGIPVASASAVLVVVLAVVAVAG